MTSELKRFVILSDQGIGCLLALGLMLACLGVHAQTLPRLDWGTYHGGTAGEAFRDLYTDKDGYTYVIGSTMSPNGISTPGSQQPMAAGGPDVFLAKYSPEGTRLWATYFGGPDADQGQHVTMDTTGGFLYISGFTNSTTGIVTAGAYQGLLLGSTDAFLAKFDTSGTLIWSTYYGGSEGETCNAVAVDPDGHVTITGWTNSPDNIASPGAYQPIFRGQQDIFIAQFDGNGARRWSTYYGDIGFDIGLQVAALPNGDLIISGWTSSVINIASPGAPQNLYAGGTADAYLLKFSQDGNRIWGTYFGGTLEEYGDALYVAPGGDIFLAGPCTSPNGLATPGTHQPTIGGNFDGFIARFDPMGNQLWGSYYGGSDIDVLYGVTGGLGDGVIIAGHGRSTTNISTPNAHQVNSGGDWDAFIAQLDADGDRVWASYYGGSDADQAFGIATDSAGYIYTTGYSFSPNQISTPGAVQENNGGNDDGFVARFAPCTEPVLTLTNGGYLCSGSDIVLSLEFSGVPPFTVQWSFDGVIQPPIQSDTTTLFVFVQGSQWQDSIILLGVTSGPCVGTIMGPFPWVKAVEPVVVSNVTIDCNQMDQTYTVSGDMSGGIFAFLDAGTTEVFISGTTFTSIALPFNDPYNIGITSGLTCDTVILQGFSGCTLVCPENFGSIRPDTTICNGDDLPLYASGGTGYAWTGPDNFSSALQNPVIANVSEINEGTYTVTVTDVNGCPDTIMTFITVHTVNGTISADQSVCFGDDIQLNASGGLSYAWSGPDNFSSASPNPTISNAGAINAGLYTVTITDGQSCSTILSTNVAVVAPPVVNLSGNSPVCEGAALQLNASGGTTYLWSGPNGFTSMSANPVRSNITLADAGLYTVSVSDGSSCITTAQIDIIVLDGPVVSFTTNAPRCAGEDLVLNASGAESYQWTGPAGFSSTDSAPVITAVGASQAGIYTLEGINANGCRDTISQAVTINPLPTVILAQHPTPYCEGEDVALTVNAAVTYAWSGPNGFTSSQQSPVIANITLLQQGVYAVTITDANGCTNEDDVTVQVTESPNVVLAFGETGLCEGDALDWTITSTNGPATYTWSGPNGHAGTGNPIALANVTLANAGWYVITATATSPAACTTVDSIALTVFPKPVALITGPDTICAGESVTLTASGGSVYLWSTGQATAVITDAPAASTLYEVIVTENDCRDTTDFLVNVKPLPILQVSAPDVIDIGTSAQLQVSGADAYLWSPATGLSCTDCPNPVASPTATIEYCVTGITEGCTSDTCVTLTVREECDFALPNVFTPNFDGINDTWCSPLPACADEQTLTVFDRWGGALYQVTGTSVCWDGLSDGKAVNPGVFVYLLELTRPGKEPQFVRGEVTVLR
jgi:gliding motility-associated-like protein